MSYIAYNHWQKLKKLAWISQELISTYGFFYFLNVAKIEFGKQGLSIFRPDDNVLLPYELKDCPIKYQIGK